MKKNRLILILGIIGAVICLLGSIYLIYCNFYKDWGIVLISSLLALYALFQIVWGLTIFFKK